ncbi:MAG: hypothetical protein AAFN94_00510 [Pseudomonadota bacterium]
MGRMQDIGPAWPFAATRPFDTVLYLGPGLARAALALSGADAKRLVAFADAKTHRLLTAPGGDTRPETTSHLAIVSPTGTEGGLYDHTMMGFASVRAATGLKTLFPGLQAQPQTPVETRALTDAVNSAGITGTHNLLILGATGCEGDILQALAASEQLQLFSRILLPLPSLPLYENSHDGPAMAAQLDAACYTRIWTDTEDPDLPLAAFDLDQVRQADRAALADRDARIASLTDQLDQLTRTLDETRDAHNAALNSAKTAQREEHETATAALQTKIDGLSDTLKLRNAEITELKTRLARIETAHAETQEQHDTEIAALRAQLARAEAADADHQQEAEALRTRLQTSTERVTQLEQQLGTLQASQSGTDQKAAEDLKTLRSAKTKSDADLAIALRMQALREADLAELRDRYQALTGENAHLSDLLRRLYHDLDFLVRRKRSPKKGTKGG